MRLAIGIIAHNEEAGIQQSIASIGQQSIVLDPSKQPERLSIVCLANGCSDRTEEFAAEAMQQLMTQRPSDQIEARVFSIGQASKENAWNVFVHDVSDRSASYLIMMDGDVQLINPDSLWLLISELETNPHARIAGGNTVKDIGMKWSLNPLHWLSLATTSLRMTQPGQLCGMLYCGRTVFLRRFRVPEFIVGEDAFLHAMTATSLFTEPPDQTRFVRVEDATVMFEAYTTPRSVWKNLKRRQVGYCIKGMLYSELWKHAGCERDAGKLMDEWTREDPQWGRKMVERRVAERGRWVIPKAALWTWMKRLGGMSWPKQILYFPAAVAASLINAFVILSANSALRSGETRDLWAKKVSGIESKSPPTKTMTNSE